MKQKLTELLKDKKSGKILFIAGIVGIALIYLSTAFSEKGQEKTDAKKEETSFLASEYREDLERQVKEIVTAISGDTAAVVTVTLDTEVTYVYADEKKQNNESATDTAIEETEQTYITVTDSNGTERPLIVTTYMPKVRGVAIVCNLQSAQIEENIQGAVMAALDITSRKIFISDKKGE